MTSRDANRGACAQACRWKYSLVEENRPGEYFPVFEDERGTYIFNSKDLCLLDYVPNLIQAGTDSFKIEGRMKSMHYVATVVSVYRQAIDAYFADPDNFKVQDRWNVELCKVSHRNYTQGFMQGVVDEQAQVYSTSSYKQTHDFVGLTKSYDSASKRLYIEQRNNIKKDELVEILQPDGRIFSMTLADMRNDKNELIEVAPHPHQSVSIACNEDISPNSLVRREIRA